MPISAEFDGHIVIARLPEQCSAVEVSALLHDAAGSHGRGLLVDAREWAAPGDAGAWEALGVQWTTSNARARSAFLVAPEHDCGALVDRVTGQGRERGVFLDLGHALRFLWGLDVADVAKPWGVSAYLRRLRRPRCAAHDCAATAA